MKKILVILWLISLPQMSQAYEEELLFENGQVIALPAGKVYYQEADRELHDGLNAGNAPIEAIMIELKTPVALDEEETMNCKKAQEVVEDFYKYFNASELDKLFGLIDDNIVHQINYGKVMFGKDEFIKYVTSSLQHCEEQVTDCILMTSENNRSVAAKFTTKGKYLHADESAIPAKGQNYELSVINYFEIENGKIVNARCWYDENAWIQQVSK